MKLNSHTAHRLLVLWLTAAACCIAAQAQHKNGHNRLGLETITYRAQVWV